ncbi:MAG TPA: restriction endonuclease subunit S, partial [Archangium sp.]
MSRRRNEACPAHWERVRLNEIATVQNGFPFPSSGFNREGGTPVIRIRDVGQADTETYFKGSFDPSFLVGEGDIVIGMDGEFRCRRWQGRPALLNQRVCRLKLTTPEVDERYLLSLMQPYLDDVERVTSSITV